jgi:hypothetical protein
VARFSVRGKPDEASAVTGLVPGGDPLLVIREQGEWALVVHRNADSTAIGWAPRALIAVP